VRTIFQAIQKGVFAAIFPHQRRRLRKQYTPTNPTANPPPERPTAPKTRTTTRELRAINIYKQP
jgi:hypothetical protein